MGNVFQDFPRLMSELNLRPGTLVHVGAHEGQEMKFYRMAGFRDTDITLVEPIPQLVRDLRRNFPNTNVVECACANTTGNAEFHINAMRTNVSSLGRGPLDKIARTITVPVRPLSAVAPGVEYMVIDAQGFELDVMRSADWSKVKLAIVEACTIKDSTMASHFPEVVKEAEKHGFRKVNVWSRSYDWVHRWCRGIQSTTGAEILDVALARAD